MVLLIGATSFLGPSVLKKLLETGYEASCLIRTYSDKSGLLDTAKSAGKKILFSSGTLRSSDSIISALKKANSVIYMVDLEHTGLLENFLSAARRAEIKRAVFISSTTVLIPQDSMVKNQKIDSEKLIANSELDYTILRPTMIYGSKDDNNFSKMIRFIKKRGFFVTFGNGNNLIQPIYIEDVADSIIRTIDNKNTYGKIYNIAGKDSLKYRDMLDIVRNKLKKNFKIIKLPLQFSKFLISIYAKISGNPSLTPGQIERMGIDKVYSYHEAAADFDFSPVSFEDGIERLIKELEVKN
ncbi:MAG: NAD-dependent epimerase/dehydratase family protein [Actinomycetota bacterium]